MSPDEAAAADEGFSIAIDSLTQRLHPIARGAGFGQ